MIQQKQLSFVEFFHLMLSKRQILKYMYKVNGTTLIHRMLP